MATTPEEILAQGKGPVQTNWVDQPAQHVSPTTSQRPETSEEPTGVENVKHDTVTAQGAPNNPQNSRELVERGLVNDGAPAPTEHTTGNNGKKLSYVEMFQQMFPYKPPTEEELEKERKKQKRESIFAAISDGIAALSNLYFTSQYAPNAYDPSKGMSATTKARFDKLKKEREEKHRQYMEGFMRAMQLDDSANYKDTLAQLKDKEQKRKDAATNISIALKQADIDLKESKKDGQEYLNELYRLKGVAFANGMDAEAQLIEEKINTEKARQYNLYNRGNGGSHSSGGSGSSGMEQYPAYNPTTGETINITAKDIKHAWSQCPQGFTIRQEPSSTITDRTSDSGRRTKTTHQVTTKNSNDNLDGPRRGGKDPESKGHSEQTQPKWSNASKIKY